MSASNFLAYGLGDPGTADRISRRQVTPDETLTPDGNYFLIQ